MELQILAAFVVTFICVEIFRRVTNSLEQGAEVKAEPEVKKQSPKRASPVKHPMKKKTQRKVKSLGIVESAKIAQQTIKSFNPDELLEVSDFIPKHEIMEALQGLHERLRSAYEYNLMEHYENKLQIKNVTKEEIASQVSRCMEQGFEGILKLEELQGLFGDGVEKNVGRTISKRRSWSEISGKEH